MKTLAILAMIPFLDWDGDGIHDFLDPCTNDPTLACKLDSTPVTSKVGFIEMNGNAIVIGPMLPNPDSILASDYDGDGIFDFADNCLTVFNPRQETVSGSAGNACNADLTGDGILGSEDQNLIRQLLPKEQRRYVRRLFRKGILHGPHCFLTRPFDSPDGLVVNAVCIGESIALR